MSRPVAKELTERELEVMHTFWDGGEMTAIEARDRLAAKGIDRAYVTVANLVRILVDRNSSKRLMMNDRSSTHRFERARTYRGVSSAILSNACSAVPVNRCCFTCLGETDD